MGKLTLNKLKSVELSDKLVKTAEAIKGGNKDGCHVIIDMPSSCMMYSCSGN